MDALNLKGYTRSWWMLLFLAPFVTYLLPLAAPSLSPLSLLIVVAVHSTTVITGETVITHLIAGHPNMV